jgi:FkbM family methyltransferase
MRPTLLLTSHGAVVFVDTTSGELRHGPLVGSPSNVVLVREGEQARIRFVGADGQQDLVFLPEYSAIVGSDKVRTNEAAIAARSVFSCLTATDKEFGLTARGKFLCAEADGRITLSRSICKRWETFHVQPDAFITTWRIKDRQKFFAPLLPLDALCFDIGANHGEHTAAFLSAGARRVVAVEPQAELANFIVEAFPKEIKSGTVIVRAQAVGSERGVAKLFPAQDSGKSMSTLSALFVEIARANGRRWDETAAIEVNVVTLDSLIDEFGVPDYVKIDVEGFDFEVLRGLSRPIALLSFEFNTQPRLIEIAEQCIGYIDRLGRYEFNYQAEAPGQAWLQFEKWVSPGVMRYTLRHDMARAKLFGDIFARLRERLDHE